MPASGGTVIQVMGVLFRDPVEVELAAAEVEGSGVAADFLDDGIGELVDAFLSEFTDFDEAGLLEDAEVFGNVVSENSGFLAEFCDTSGTTDEASDEGEACGLAESPHGGETIEMVGGPLHFNRQSNMSGRILKRG
jgi:hypothetical protein